MKNSPKKVEKTATVEGGAQIPAAALPAETAAPPPGEQSVRSDDNVTFDDPPSEKNGSFWADEAVTPLATRIRRVWVKADLLVTPLADEPLSKGIHFPGAFGEKKPPILCAGPERCALCLAGEKVIEQHHLTMFSVDERDMVVISMDKGSTPGSLRQQLRPYMEHDCPSDQVLRIESVGNKRFRVSLQVDLGKSPELRDDYGDDVVRKIISDGLPTEAEILSTFDKRTNIELLDEMPQLWRKIHLRHPHLTIDQVRSL